MTKYFFIATAIMVGWVAVEAECLKPTGAAASSRPYIALADYCMDLKAYDAAYVFYAEAAKHAPKNHVEYGKALTNLAVLCGNRNEWENTKGYLERALQYAPGLEIPKKRLEWLRKYKPYLF